MGASKPESAASPVERRTFLKKVAITGLATAWAAPVVQTVGPALAHHPPPPSPHGGGTPTGDTPTTTGDTHPPHSEGGSHTKDDSDHSGGRSRDNSKDKSHSGDYSH